MTDFWVFEEEEEVGGTAANLLLLSLSLNTCHSERSEEYHGFSRTIMKKNVGL
jgi:hypothetical protein